MRSSRVRYRLLDAALTRGVFPDGLLRWAARSATTRRVEGLMARDPDELDRYRRELVERMRSGPIAEYPHRANEQHYELPAEFFELFLGPWRKYSCGYWTAPTSTLAESEEAMMELTCRRAGIEPGMTVLDLGCGWGSLSLWLAEREGVTVHAVSNSHSQRHWIERERDRRGLGGRLDVTTCDINDYAPAGRFDRVMSIEMFEHLRNWSELLRRVSTWIREDGRVFVHVFTHRDVPYGFGESTWAAERFFSSGLMPSHDLLPAFDGHLVVIDGWPQMSGTHYERTLLAWLELLDAARGEALRILSDHVGRARAPTLLATWRLFLIATASMWGSHRGAWWGVSHYLLERRGNQGTSNGVRSE